MASEADLTFSCGNTGIWEGDHWAPFVSHGMTGKHKEEKHVCVPSLQGHRYLFSDLA